LIHYTPRGTLTTGKHIGEEGKKMVFDEPRRPVRPEIVLGEDLSLHSLEELETRIEALKVEIARIESVLAEKKSSRSAAETVFRR